MLLGDINCDFLRRTGHTKEVASLIDEYSLVKSWEKFEVDFTHIHENRGKSFTSTIDHFLWNQGFDKCISKCGVLHSADNNSDHSPIYCVIDDEEIETCAPKLLLGKEKPCWKKADQNQRINYSAELEQRLSQLHIPSSLVECKDVHCRDSSHLEESDQFMTSILHHVETSAMETLPILKPPNNKTKKNVPGWAENVRPFRENALFWSQVWKSAGRPINTELHKIMKRTKNIFHYQVRKCKKAEDFIKRNKLLDACINGNGNIFAEIKKMRKSKPVVATSMDNENEDIPNHFKEIYCKLYNSANDKDDMKVLKSEVEGSINHSQLDDVDKVTAEVVKEAAGRLKDNKTDPTFLFSSDCLKNGPDRLFNYLSVAIKSYLVHGHVTIFLLLATLVPIVKDKLGNINYSKNNRSIAISSLILKLIDWIILILFGVTLGLDDLQFAYQPGCSTTMCTWAAVETISYFLRNGSEVYTCCMDMTKAFDLVKHSILFRKLLQAGMSTIFVRLLLFVYMMQFANVRWNGEVSNMFTLSNGVRQGGIISAILYCFYVNELFQLLRKSGYGCWINGKFAGIFGYSDDNLLIAPSLHSLQEMLKICEMFALTNNLQFSTDPNPKKCKTKCIAFLRKKRQLPPLLLCGNTLPWAESFKHLGNNIENEVNGMKLDMKVKKAQFVAKNCELNQEFYFSHPSTRFQVSQIFCSHFTGSPLWNIFSDDAVKMESSWNVNIKIAFDLPFATHRSLIKPITGTSHIKEILVKRFLSFLNQIKNSPKQMPKHILNTIKLDVRSTTGSNLRNILLLTNKSNIDKLELLDFKCVNYHPIKKEDDWKPGIILEITDVKFNQLEVDGFSFEELEEILDYVCTS